MLVWKCIFMSRRGITCLCIMKLCSRPSHQISNGSELISAPLAPTNTKRATMPSSAASCLKLSSGTQMCCRLLSLNLPWEVRFRVRAKSPRSLPTRPRSSNRVAILTRLSAYLSTMLTSLFWHQHQLTVQSKFGISRNSKISTLLTITPPELIRFNGTSRMFRFYFHAPRIRLLLFWILDSLGIKLSIKLFPMNLLKAPAGMLTLHHKLLTLLIKASFISLMQECLIRYQLHNKFIFPQLTM